MVLQTKFIVNKDIPTLRTDMVVVEYNPDFLNDLAIEVAMFALVHEIAHIFLKHGFRRGGRNPRKWNRACDHAINLMLKDSGMQVWSQACQDPKYAGMSAEVIHDLLPDEPEDDGIGDDLMDGPSDSSAQAQANRQIDQMIASATTSARLAGKMPGNLERVVDDILNKPVPWNEVLAAYLQRVSHDDMTWSRRNRRWEGIYMPARWNKSMGEFVVIGDTSASMDNSVFGRIASEINYAIDTVNPERVRVVWADDAECSLQEVFERGEEVKLHPKGGGGTDMRKPLRFIEQHDPVVVVLVTDCWTPWPSEPTPYPLIVLSTTDAPSPDWAMRIRIGVE
jgi:predicted metal-dependent peptidase